MSCEKNSSNDRDAIWGAERDKPKEAWITWGPDPPWARTILVQVYFSKIKVKVGKGTVLVPRIVGAATDFGWFPSSITGDADNKPSSRLTLLSATPTVTFPALEHHRPWLVPICTAWQTEPHV